MQSILVLFAPGCRRRSVDNSRNSLERVGEVTPNEVFHHDDVNLVTVLGVHLPQSVSLSRPDDSDNTVNGATYRNTLGSLTPERGSPFPRGGSKYVSRCSRTHQ